MAALSPYLLFCSVASAFFTILFVGSRLYFRRREKNLGWDDLLLASGLILYLGFTAACGYGTFAGIGAQIEITDSGSKLYPEESESLGLTFFIAMILYSSVLVCIKSAVCILFLRIAGSIRSYRTCIYGILGVTVVGFVVTEAGTMGQCRPIEANWSKSVHLTADCASQDTLVIIASFSTITTVMTDWLCALFPVYMLWRTSMPVRKKLAAGVVLGLGALASICTLLRIPYIIDYNALLAGHSKNGKPYDLGGLLLWSVLECGIGLIATALPPIWHAYQVRRRARIHQVLPDDEAGSELPAFNRFPNSADTVHGRKAGSIETVSSGLGDT
ncbi:hypothetical protein PG993_006060 [Apiospora rasikravindrae]|uniref:Rhodopsin domain-containing protein n=1 Tax=Apiospora rasikravindrae TaxID=990691 RepID=A0ABR1TAJ1_9PEZI